MLLCSTDVTGAVGDESTNQHAVRYNNLTPGKSCLKPPRKCLINDVRCKTDMISPDFKSVVKLAMPTHNLNEMKPTVYMYTYMYMADQISM